MKRSMTATPTRTDPTTMAQADRFASPWGVGEKVRLVAWGLAWPLLCRWTPKHLISWRNLVLKLFGCRITGKPFVHPTAIIRAPWRLTLEHKACLGPRCEVYNLGPVTLHERATVAQYAYLCAGSHDFSQEHRPLTVAPIVLEADCFVGAKAMILLGVTIGRGAIVGAGAVVAKDVTAASVVVGNPGRVIRSCMGSASQSE